MKNLLVLHLESVCRQRFAAFERRGEAARLALSVATDVVAAGGSTASALPPAYRDASLRVLDLVARSVHPAH